MSKYTLSTDKYEYKISLSRTGGQGAAADFGGFTTNINPATTYEGDLITLQNNQWVNVSRNIFVSSTEAQTVDGVKTFLHPIQGSISGNSGTATKLFTPRTISLNGAVTGSTTFDGSANAAITAVLENSGVTAGTYGGNAVVPVITVDAKGRITNVTTQSVANTITVNGDTGTTTISGNGTPFVFEGAEGITTVATSNKISISADYATNTVKGIAAFNVNDFSVASGVVSITGTYAKLASPAFTGTPTAPTPVGGDNSTRIATTAYVRGEVSSLIAGAPALLDTLSELATALGNDSNFSTTVSTALGNRLIKSNNLSDLTSISTARTNLGGTTVGSNLFTLANPNAVRFIRINADNTVSALDSDSFKTALGLTAFGTVTSVNVSGGTTGLTTTNGPITTSGTITLAGTLNVANGGTGATSLTGYIVGNGTAAFQAVSQIPAAHVSGLGTMAYLNADALDGLIIDCGTY